jgi:type VI secretion system secreted protein VgrG
MAQATVEVTLGGKALPAMVVVDAVDLMQPVFDHHRCRIALSSSDVAAKTTASAAGKLDDVFDALGKPLELRVKPTTPGRSDSLLFKGITSSVRGVRSFEGGFRVLVEGSSPTILLETGPRNRIWEKKSFKQIAQEILDGADASLLPRDLGGIPGGPTFEFEAQYQESDFNLLCRLAQREQVWVFYDGEKLYLTGAPKGQSTGLNLDKGGPGKLGSFTVQARCAPDKFQYRSFMAGAAQEAKKTDKDAGKPGGLPAYVDLASGRSSSLFSTESHAFAPIEIRAEGDSTRHAQSLGQAWLSSLVEASGECEWAGLRPGSTVSISGAGGKEDGDYLLTRVDHRVMAQGGYSSSFTSIPYASARPVWNRFRPPAPAVHHAIVMENYDKAHPGQVKVQYCHPVDGTTDAGTSKEGKATTTWVRVASPHAGASGGFFALPEPGDEVLVAHIDARADQPVVVASLYNGKGSKTLDALTDDLAKNDGKAFRTKSGNLILIRDTSGKERIEITTPDAKNRLTLTMDNGPLIEVETQGKVHIKAKDAVSVEAGKDITMSADGALSLKAQKAITIESATDKVQVKAMTTAEVSGTQGVDVKGTKVTINGDATVDVKGATVGVSGSAMTSIKGALVKIN